MRLDSRSLLELRDQLRLRGERISIAPAEISAPPKGPLSPDALAVVQRVSPLCEVLYLLLVADDREDVREHDVLRGAIRALTDGALRTQEIERMLGRYAAILEGISREARLEQVTAQLALDRSDAEAAFTVAAAIAIADEHPDERERAMLGQLREMLGIPSARALRLLGEVGIDPTAE